MSTGYMQPEGQPLRHGHTLNGRPSNWHPAAENHPDDPTAHAIGDSWNVKSFWWKGNRDLPNAIKVKLINDAHTAHDLGAPSPSFQVPTPRQDNGAPSNGVIDADTLQRLEDVETLSTAAATTSNAAAEQADRLAKKVDDQNKAIAAFKAEIADLKDAKQATVRYEIFNRSTGQLNILNGPKHQDFDKIWRATRKMAPKRRNFWLAGPAGSGKSFITDQIATALGARYDGYGTILNMIQFAGYQNANGDYVETVFYDFYKNGGVLFLDECDGNIPEAMVALNMALANGYYSFPLDKHDPTRGGRTKRHEDCYIFATANTLGAGATAQYSGRFKQDDAFMDRFLVIPMDYDPKLEKSMIATYAHEWVDVVQKVRQAAREAAGRDPKAGFVISPRASEKGMDLLYDGGEGDEPMSKEEIVELVFGRYRNHQLWAHVGRAAEDWARS